jgi:hypothetical protein
MFGFFLPRARKGQAVRTFSLSFYGLNNFYNSFVIFNPNHFIDTLLYTTYSKTIKKFYNFPTKNALLQRFNTLKVVTLFPWKNAIFPHLLQWLEVLLLLAPKKRKYVFVQEDDRVSFQLKLSLLSIL